MKKLKKIGLACLILVICFCSCFMPIHAYQDNFMLGENGSNYQSAIGDIEVGIGSVFGQTSVDNQSLPLSTSFYFADPPKQYDALVSIVNDFGIETYFSYDQMLDQYLIDQNLYFNHSGVIDFTINFQDVYIDSAQLNLIPQLTIKTNSTNIEQQFYATYSYTYFDVSDYSMKTHTETQPIELIKGNFDNSDFYTYDLQTLFENLLSGNTFDSEYGNHYGYFYEFIFNVQSLDGLSSSNTLEIGLSQMSVLPNYHTIHASIFDSYIAGIDIVDPTEVSIFDWLIDSIGSFMNTEIFPNFSIGVLLGTIVAIPLLIYILRLFMGG